MNKAARRIILAVCSLLISAGACCAVFCARLGLFLVPAFAAAFFVGFFLLPAGGAGLCGARMFFLNWGTELLGGFVISLCVSIGWHIFLLFALLPENVRLWFVSVGVCAVLLAAVFWTGIILVYCLSFQLGVRQRVLGVLCGLVPVLNLIMLGRIIRLCSGEVGFEFDKIRLDKSRAGEKVCATRYPVLLVHGVFFRDFRHINYWGRIPRELEKNGAKIYYGEHQSAASVYDSGRELCERIRSIAEESGCKKVNVIAHSKGGLDVRAACMCGAAPYIASLTTVNTPHRGCEFADYLLNVIPGAVKEKVAKAYNAAAHRLGDENPDFLAAAGDLTAAACSAFDKEAKMPEGIYCRGVMSKMKKASGGKFPLNFTYELAKYFDGEGDGLVAVENARWGEDFTLVLPEGERGISHGDMIDLNRENIPGFDVREFYVGLVRDLKNRGL